MAACAVHRSFEATEPCPRCGTFGCEACFPPAGTRRLCGSCRQRLRGEAGATSRRVTLVTRAVRVGLGLALVSNLIELVLHGSLGAELVAALSGVRLLAVLACIVWTGLATAHAKRLGWAVGSAGWAATSWLIPGVSFVMPFIAIARLVPGKRGRVVGWAMASGVSLLLSVVIAMVAAMASAPNATPTVIEAVEDLLARLVPLGLALEIVSNLLALSTLRVSERLRLDEEATLAS